jgi:hypothetical protein
MSIYLSKNLIEIKRPVTGELILNTDKILPHVTWSGEFLNFATVTDMTGVVSNAYLNPPSVGPFNDIESFNIASFPIPIPALSDSLFPLIWVKLSNATGPLGALQTGYMHVPGTLILELFRHGNAFQDTGGMPVGYNGMIAVNTTFEGSTAILQISRTLAALKPGAGLVGFQSTAGPLYHSVVGQETNSFNIPRTVSVTGTGFTLSLKVSLLRITK